MKKVYIAGKLNDMAVDYIKNVHNMIEWSEKVRKLGFSVFVPAIDFMLGVTFGDWEYKDYFENSQPWLEVSDYIFVCPGSKDSKGTQMEIESAKKLNIPVVYSLEELVLPSDVIKKKILSTISEQLGIPLAEIKDSDTLIEDLQADSLDLVELTMALEEEFSLEITDEETEKLLTVRDIVEYIKEKIK